MNKASMVIMKCKKCYDIIWPDGKGTLIKCKCKAIAVDGKYDKNGEGYCRMIGNTENYEVIR